MRSKITNTEYPMVDGNAGERIDTHWTKVATEAGHLHRVGVYVLGTAAPR